MKNLMLIVCLSILSFSATAQITAARLTASGLTCSMCSKAIFKALEKLPFVSDIKADVETSEYILTFKPGTTAKPDAIKDAVEKAGFGVASFEITATLPRLTVQPDAHVNLASATYHLVGVAPQTLEGIYTFQLLDKAYLPKKDHEKYGKLTSMKCYTTGTMESCCEKGTAKRVYHVTLKS